MVEHSPSMPKALGLIPRGEKKAEDLNRHFTKEVIIMSNKLTKGCSETISHVKTTVRTFTTIRMAIVKNRTQNTKCRGGLEEAGALRMARVME